jgi:bifunctional enzyme CysN/CysC
MATSTSAQAAKDQIDAYLEAHERRSVLRFITCGSVDDGKSTLVGRLLYESKRVFDDQLAALAIDSKRVGTQGDELDYALLLDGLQAEREQGITIDVAYRYFSSERRAFVMADSPGHEQYTRNMATAASTADCAVLVVDARKGASTQTRRHLAIVALLGLREVAVAVTKMDLVDFRQRPFLEIEASVHEFASQLGLEAVTCIPTSGLQGDNVVVPSARMPWYEGPPLMEYLECVEVGDLAADGPLRMWVQSVSRPSDDFRGFAGLINGGHVARGDRIVVLPSGRESRVARIVTADGDLDLAVCGQSVTLTLEDEIDASRGDLISGADSRAGCGDQFEATVVWMSETPMLPGRNYLMKIGPQTATATVAPLKHKLGIDTLERIAAHELALNEIGVCDLELSRRIPFDPYVENRDLGGFLLIDRLTLDTVGAGMLHFALRRSENIHWQALDVDKAVRARQKRQRPCIVWLTGFSSAGKSTIANLVERQLYVMGFHTYLLDGDNVRHGLCKDLGFTAADRVENVRRVGEVASLMLDAGLIVLCSFISPFARERRSVRALVDEGEFFEVFVDASLAMAEQRDAKGLYRKARCGELVNFTGVDSPYEPPEHPELHLDVDALTPEQSAQRIIDMLSAAGVLGG